MKTWHNIVISGTAWLLLTATGYSQSVQPTTSLTASSLTGNPGDICVQSTDSL